jgi:zinc protease
VLSLALVFLGALGWGGCGAEGARDAKAPASVAPDSIPVKVTLATETMTLPNGLVVVMHQEPSAHRVHVRVRYDVGSKDDPDGRSGFAHLVEHLMFRGSRHTTAKEFSEWIAEVGGSENGSTGDDETDYHEDLPARELPLALWLESDRMAYPFSTLDEDGFRREREVVENELRERTANVAYGDLHAITRAGLFGPRHPYGRVAIGRIDELESASLDEARVFARRFYRPNNATLVICGGYDAAEAKRLVTTYFATIAPGEPVPARTAPAPVVSNNKRLDVEANVDTPLVTLAWAAPPMHGDGFEELAFGMSVVAGSSRARLVEEKKIALGVEWGYQAGVLGGDVTLTARLKRGESVDDAIAVFDEWISHNASLGEGSRFTWSSFPDEKTQRIVAEVKSLERLDGQAVRILHDLTYHGRPDAVDEDLGRIDHVKLADVGAAVERFLRTAPRLMVVVTPNPKAPRAGRLVKR